MNLMPEADLSGHELLGIYLNDHLVGASAGVELFRRSARAQDDSAIRARITELAEEVAEDREQLLALMRDLEVPVQQHRVVVGWIGEKVGRLKPNGTWVRRSPLSNVVELEAMRMGAEGKRCLWRLLLQVAQHEPRLSQQTLTELEQRATAQIEALEAMRLQAAAVLQP